MNKRLLKQIFKAFEMANRCYNTPDGPTGADDNLGNRGGSADGNTGGSMDAGDDAPADDPDKIPDDVFEQYNIPVDARDDDDVVASIREQMKIDADSNDDDSGDATGDDDTGDQDDNDNDTGDDDSPDDDGSDDDTGDDGDDVPEEFVYENDVTIAGREFKKDDLEKTPTTILKNIAEINTQLETVTTELAENKAKTDTAFDDPVIKERLTIINDGKADKPYDYYTVSKQTEEYLIENLGLDPEDPDDIKKLEGLYGEFKKDLDANVDKIVNNRLIENDQKEQAQALSKKGLDNLLAVQKFLDKKNRIEDTDLEKIWKAGDKHPSWKKFVNGKGLGDVQKTLVGSGFKKYHQLANLTPEQIYAIAGAKLGLPVALNTKRRDGKIAKDATEKLLGVFGAKKVAKALGSGGASNATKKKDDALGGIIVDEKKLMDNEYCQGLYDQCNTDEEIKEMQQTISDKLARIHK